MGGSCKKMWPSFEDVNLAAMLCMKRKRNRLDAIAFRRSYGEEIFNLTMRIRDKTYQPQAGLVFVAEHPKYREIHAAHFRDRVVHHLLYNQLEPVFEKIFIPDSYACRKGKGTHAAAESLAQKMRNISRNGQIKAYGLKMDIKSFFPSIHKETLLGLIQAKCKKLNNGDNIFELAKIIVNNDPVKNAKPLGSKATFNKVPPHKKLGALGPGYGLPIGNLTSQFFANVYLNALDQFIKRTLGIKHYVRYVDDFVLLNEDPLQLRYWEEQIRKFLKERLFLTAHDLTETLAISGGIDFVGYIIRPNYILSRNRVIKHANKRITELEKQLQPRKIGRFTHWHIDCEAIEKLRMAWASYSGHFKHSDSNRLLERMWQKHPISGFYLTPGFKRRFGQFRADDSWFKQVKRLSQGIKNAILIVQVGKYAECPLKKDIRQFHLKSMKFRSSKHSRAGVPYKLVNSLIKRSQNKNMSVALAHEIDGIPGAVKARQLKWFIELSVLPEVHSDSLNVSAN